MITDKLLVHIQSGLSSAQALTHTPSSASFNGRYRDMKCFLFFVFFCSLNATSIHTDVIQPIMTILFLSHSERMRVRENGAFDGL